MARVSAAQARDDNEADFPLAACPVAPIWTAEDEAACAEQLRMHGADFYREEAPKLQRFFERRTAPQDVPDLVQESFRRVLGHRPKHAGAFLGRTAANLLTEVRRAAARRWSRAHESLDERRLGGCDPVPQLEARDALARIDAALATLKPKTREIFLMTRVEGRSYAEVGAILGMSEDGVKKQVAKAMGHLRRDVGDL